TGARGRKRIQIYFPAEVLEKYRAGELDTRGVAERCGVSPPTAARELRRAGMAIFQRGRRPRRINAPAELLQKYRSGELNCRSLAELWGVGYGVALRTLRGLGLKIRGRG